MQSSHPGSWTWRGRLRDGVRVCTCTCACMRASVACVCVAIPKLLTAVSADEDPFSLAHWTAGRGASQQTGANPSRSPWRGGRLVPRYVRLAFDEGERLDEARTASNTDFWGFRRSNHEKRIGQILSAGTPHAIPTTRWLLTRKWWCWRYVRTVANAQIATSQRTSDLKSDSHF